MIVSSCLSSRRIVINILNFCEKQISDFEFLGNKKRYCVIDKKRLVKCLMAGNFENFQAWYKKTLMNKVELNYHARQVFWSKSFAVGDQTWLQDIYRREKFKRKKIILRTFDNRETYDNVYEAKESQAVYFIEG